jgi:hypothetical protein
MSTYERTLWESKVFKARMQSELREEKQHKNKKKGLRCYYKQRPTATAIA